MRKEIEQSQAEKQKKDEAIEQERLRVVGQINERINFLEKEARVLIRPYLQTLHQSGAIDVLKELKEEMEIRREVEIGAVISFSNTRWRRRHPLKKDRNKMLEHWQFGEYGGTHSTHAGIFMRVVKDAQGNYRMRIPLQFKGESLVMERSRDFREFFPICDPRTFKVETCYAKLMLSFFTVQGVDDGGYSVWREFSFYSSRSKRAVDLIETDGNFGGKEQAQKIFRFPESQWGNRDLLRRKVARAYFNLQ